jgi:uncharacterized protein DUF5666
MPKSSEAQAILSRLFAVVLGLIIVTLLAGCGGSNMNVPPPPGSTNVVVLMTGTANDKLVNLEVQIESVTLTNATGNSVTLLNRPVGNFVTGFTEFMHLNGASEPLAIASVPQGTYTAATVEVGTCQFTMFSKDPSTGGPLTATFQEGTCGQGTGNTTVKLSGPITISGQVMALSFNLQVSQSYTLTPPNTFTVSPVFTLTPIVVSPQPTNEQNGKVGGLDAVIASVNASGNSFMAQTTSGFVLSVNANGNTQYQGVAGLSSLAAGMLVNLDVAIQSSGLLATRVEMDNAAANTADTELPLLPAGPAGTVVVAEPQDCFSAPGAPVICEVAFLLEPGASLKVSGQFNNLQNLPFTPNFSSSTLFLGQSVFMLSSGARDGQGNLIATSLTLVPQTINGTVTAISSSGGFSVYTVALAPYDLIPTTQQLFLGPFPAVSNPASVTVYADAHTQLVQSAPIAPGSLLRFRGLILYDNGTLRMDCGRILDGVQQ